MFAKRKLANIVEVNPWIFDIIEEKKCWLLKMKQKRANATPGALESAWLTTPLLLCTCYQNICQILVWRICHDKLIIQPAGINWKLSTQTGPTFFALKLGFQAAYCYTDKKKPEYRWFYGGTLVYNVNLEVVYRSYR